MTKALTMTNFSWRCPPKQVCVRLSCGANRGRGLLVTVSKRWLKAFFKSVSLLHHTILESTLDGLDTCCQAHHDAEKPARNHHALTDTVCKSARWLSYVSANASTLGSGAMPQDLQACRYTSGHQFSCRVSPWSRIVVQLLRIYDQQRSP